MRPHATLVIAALFAASPLAHADFSIVSTDPGAAPPRPPNTEPIQPATPEAPAARPSSTEGKSGKTTKPNAIGIAKGFGAHVPLAFAVRQIVPPQIKVTYGPGTDQNAPVDWKGGRKWAAVLRDAVHPLGLKLSLHPNAVAIRQ